MVSQHLDGVDFDLENLAAGFTAGGMSAQQTVNWIATVSQVTAQAIGTFPSLFSLLSSLGAWFTRSGIAAVSHSPLHTLSYLGTKELQETEQLSRMRRKDLISGLSEPRILGLEVLVRRKKNEG